MRFLALSLATAFALAGCASDPDQTYDPIVPTPEADETAVAAEPIEVGEPVSDGEIITVAEVVDHAADLDGQTVRVAGVTEEVCQQMGCWLTLRPESGPSASPVRVKVATGDDGAYAFTFPKDIAGRDVVLVGTVAQREVPVDERRHYAEDAGATEEELAAITEPEQTIELIARGATIL
jgi:hypothetical protein